MNTTWKKVCLLLLVFIGVFLCVFLFVFNSKKSKDDKTKGDVVWDGDKVVVYEDKEVEVEFLTTSKDKNTASEGKFITILHNKSKKGVSYDVSIIGINDNVNCNQKALFQFVPAKETFTEEMDISETVNEAQIPVIKQLFVDIAKNENKTKHKQVIVDVHNIKKASITRC